jgi:hypothetical protein
VANAQVLVLVRSSAALDASQIQGPIEAAARAAGFTPGPWTFNTQSVQVTPVAAGGGSVAGGPWAGDTVSETVPAAGSRLQFNAFRQNFLNGPDPSAATPSWPFSTSAVGSTLRALPGVSSARIAFRAPGNSISWDRGVPAPIALIATAPSGSNGALLGLFAVGVLAFVASRGSSARRPALAGARGRGRLGKLSTNREGLTWEEWRRAAAVKPGTPGAHAAWAKGEDPSEWRVAAIAARARY